VSSGTTLLLRKVLERFSVVQEISAAQEGQYSMELVG
jgi:hypothetical protein